MKRNYLAFSLLFLSACTTEPTTYRSAGVSCGDDGALISYDAQDYCVYALSEQEIIETGFRCPEGLSLHQPPGAPGLSVCGPEGASPDSIEGAAREARDLFAADPEVATRPRKVDLLLVIDDSGSMCEEQAHLRDATAPLIRALVERGLDFKIGVVSTDVQNPSEAGRFQNIPNNSVGPSCAFAVDISQCPAERGEAPPPGVISATDARYIDLNGDLDEERLNLDLSCNATVGTDGYGFEMGLEAMYLALHTQNQGFVRDDAQLAIFFLTNENDCSDRGALDKTNGNICEWLSEDLVPVEEYAEALIALKGSADHVTVGGIIGPDDGARYMSGEAVNPSCLGVDGDAHAGWRYEALFSAFSHVQGDICDADYADTLGRFVDLIDEAIRQ